MNMIASAQTRAARWSSQLRRMPSSSSPMWASVLVLMLPSEARSVCLACISCRFVGLCKVF